MVVFRYLPKNHTPLFLPLYLWSTAKVVASERELVGGRGEAEEEEEEKAGQKKRWNDRFSSLPLLLMEDCRQASMTTFALPSEEKEGRRGKFIHSIRLRPSSSLFTQSRSLQIYTPRHTTQI